MSWILGMRSDCVDEHSARISGIHPSPLHLIRNTSLYLAAGGIPETCRAWSDASGAEGGVVVGM